MSFTLTCPSCDSETPSKHNFCIICNQQTKCLNPACHAELVPGKDFCFGCGQPIVKKVATQTQLNKYVRSVKQQGKNYEEHTELSATDQAVSELAPFIVGQITRSPQRPYPPVPHDASMPPPPQVTEINNPLASEEAPQLPGSIEASKQAVLSEIVASRYFEHDGDVLIATVKDFKGKTWADQQRRFILLYASAYYQAFGQTVPSKEHFKTAAEKASVLDPINFTKYLTELTRKYLSEIGGGYKLNQDGEKEVRNIIAYMEDENVDVGYEYWGRSTNLTTKRYRQSKDNKLKLQEWAQEEVELGNLKVRDIQKAGDYAMVALWLITIHLRKADAVRWNDAYYYFEAKFKTISVTSVAFGRAMMKHTNAKYFRKNGDLYFLSSEGQRKVEDWIAGKSFESSNEVEDSTDV